MDDKQRIALVETRTQGGRRLAAATDPLPVRQPSRLGSLELDDAGADHLLRGVHALRQHVVSGRRSGHSRSPKRYRYTGKERDEESGLHYHGARYYAPWLGRWTSCDPKGFIDGTNLL